MDGWIEWGGGEMPVPATTMVDVRFCDGEECRRTLADDRHWKDDDYNIVAYRISDRDIAH